MGQVDLDFKPTVPVFDANVALGRHHNRVVSVDTAEGTLSEMDRAGIQRALVYAPHAVNFDSDDGNNLLLEMIEGEDRLIPQFVCNPSYDNLDEFSAGVEERGVRAVKVAPIPHGYPFRDWIVGPWMEWLASVGIPVWVDAPDADPAELYDAIKRHPNVNFVLSQVHYRHAAWALPMLRGLENTNVEISRFLNTEGIERLLDAAGGERVLFGSRFPDSPMSPQLYSLHLNDLSESTLKAVCAGNLERLMGLK